MVLLDNLNAPQREAVEYCDGPLLVIAGAGSGKTRVITYKIAYLIQERNVAPRRIFAATFTNKAAGEMKRRISRLLDIPIDTPMNIATFHSLCARILRREAQKIGISSSFAICDDRDQLALLKACLKEMNVSEKNLMPGQAQDLINQVKMRMIQPEDLPAETILPNLRSIFLALYELYHKRLRENDALDFEDLINEVILLLRKDEATRKHYQGLFQYVLVDEFQDTNFSQYELVKLLAGAHHHICVVGDEDQSIYSWRGAEIDNLLSFSDDFPDVKIVKLEQNYRSTGTILEVASTVIANNEERLGKWLWTDSSMGEPVYIMQAADEIDEARRVAKQIHRLHRIEGIPLSEIAVFYRQSSLSRLIEDKLREEKLPYRVVGGIKFYDRSEIKDLISYLRVVSNPHNSLSLQRIINRPTRGIGEKTVEQLTQWSIEHEASLYDALVAALDNGMLTLRVTNKIAEFLARLNAWRRDSERTRPDDLLLRIIEDTGYLDALGNPKSLEVISKKDNIAQLFTSIKEFINERGVKTTLDEYLEIVALSTYADDIRDNDVVSLMTIHCAKGLEFAVVFLIGLDEPIFPSHRTLEETGNIEEERRLFYVALTRCKKLLFLCRANVRSIWGKKQFLVPSRFLSEMPRDRIAPYMDRVFDV